MIEDTKLDEILAKAKKINAGTLEGRALNDAEEDFIYACDPRMIAAIIIELQGLRFRMNGLEK